MTADPRLAVAYNLCHPQAEPDVVNPLIEKLRQQAVALGFVRVSELFCHTSQADILGSHYCERFLIPDLEIVPAIPTAACYFLGSLPDSDPWKSASPTTCAPSRSKVGPFRLGIRRGSGRGRHAPLT